MTDSSPVPSNYCADCGKPATQWVLVDPFGKSDAKKPLCGEHSLRIRDPADVAEIERLTRDLGSAQASWNAACQDIERLRAGLLEAVKLLDEDVPRATKSRLCRLAEHDCEFARDPVPETELRTQWMQGPPAAPGSHVVHYESGYYAVLTLTPNSMILRSRRDDNPYGIVRHFQFDATSAEAQQRPLTREHSRRTLPLDSQL